MSLPEETEEFLKNFDLQQNLDIPPIDDAMSDLRQRIEPDFQETVGFEYDSEKSDYSEKTKDVFRRTFERFLSRGMLDQSNVNLMDVATLLENEIHHRLKRIRLIENKTLRKMYMQTSSAYEIPHSNTLFFHGTTAENVEKIIRTGFNERMCERDRFGKGCYLATTVNHGMLYADPLAKGLQKKQLEEGDLTQCIVVCYVLTGHKAVGHEGQKDFGFTNEGKEITTLTDFRETMIVVSRKSQILPIAVIEIEYQPHLKYTEEIKRRLGNFHPYIDQLIRQNLTAKNRKTETILSHYERFKNGCKVRLNHIIVAPKLNAKTGVIQLIVKFDHGTRIYITVDNEDSLVEQINKNRRVYNAKTVTVQPNWLLCLPDQLTLC